jgi:polysaccharide biosynthesis transport protein
MEADLRAAEREHRLALDEVQTLQVELNGARASLTAPGSGVVNTPSQSEQELDRARSELARIKGIYTEDHPDVRAQQRRIVMLEQAVRAEGSSPSPTRDNAAAQARLAVSRLEARIETARARANLLADQQRNLRNSIGEQRAQILRAPQVERELATLQRDYEAARTQYADLRAKQLSAQLVENLEGEQKGERFTLLEPPLLPEYAVKPERRKLVALGFFVAIAAAVAVVLVLEKLFGRVQGLTAVTALTGQRPMVVVPYITTAEETRSLEVLRKRVYWAGICFGVVALVIVHTTIVPLHSLFISLFSHLD